MSKEKESAHGPSTSSRTIFDVSVIPYSPLTNPFAGGVGIIELIKTLILCSVGTQPTILQCLACLQELLVKPFLI